MSTFRAAVAAAVIVLGAAAPTRATETLRLDDAFQRVIQSHPELAVLRYREASLRAQVEQAAQSAPLQLGASAENILGSGTASGVSGAELTVSLASVLERGAKRAARVALAEQHYRGVDLQREAKQLDLLAEVARRYLDVAAAGALSVLAQQDMAQRQRAAAATSKRVAAGAAPESVRLAAQAAVTRAQGALSRAELAQTAAIRRLALLWGEHDPHYAIISGELAALPPVRDYSSLIARLAASPEIRRFANETRIREARLQLARSARSSDIEWQLGVRRLESDHDWGLVGSLSIPFGNAERARPAIRAAEADLSALDLEREGQTRTLETTLLNVAAQIEMAVAEARHIDDALLPLLQQAEQAAERAYRTGALSHLEWAQLQSEITASQRDRLHASISAHRGLIELQRLTGESLLPASTQSKESQP